MFWNFILNFEWPPCVGFHQYYIHFSSFSLPFVDVIEPVRITPPDTPKVSKACDKPHAIICKNWNKQDVRFFAIALSSLQTLFSSNIYQLSLCCLSKLNSSQTSYHFVVLTNSIISQTYQLSFCRPSKLFSPRTVLRYHFVVLANSIISQTYQLSLCCLSKLNSSQTSYHFVVLTNSIISQTYQLSFCRPSKLISTRTISSSFHSFNSFFSLCKENLDFLKFSSHVNARLVCVRRPNIAHLNRWEWDTRRAVIAVRWYADAWQQHSSDGITVDKEIRVSQ